jgi:hypothetical protein
MAKFTEGIRIPLTPAQKKLLAKMARTDNRNTTDYARNILFPPKK